MATEDDDLTFETLDALARWLDTPFNTVQTNWRKSGLPGDRGCWSARDAARWLAAQYGSRKSNSAEADEKRSAEARKLLADAGMKEFLLEKARGDYVNRTDARLELAEFLIQWKDGVARIAPSLRPILPRELVEEIVRKVDQGIKLETKALVNRIAGMRSLREGGDDETEEGAAEEGLPEEPE